ncbi:MAG: hypothetical protein ACM3PY_21450 [Omnitrophica WOR_2 bacterium]
MDKSFKQRFLGNIFAVFLVISTLTSCSLPSPVITNAPGVQITPNTVYTQAAQTVVAQLTQAAETQAPSQPGELSTPTTAPVAATATEVSPTATTVPPTATTQITPTATLVATVATATATATSVPTDPKLSLGTPTFSDTFQNGDNWSLSKDQHSDMYVKNDRLVMVAFKPDQFDSWALTWPKTVNFYIEMTASPETCGGLDRYGLMLRANRDANKGYLLGFSCDGKYSFRMWNGKKYTKLVDWTSSSLIVKGANQTNRLGIKAVGNKFSLYANGQLLKTITDNTYSTGFFGVFIAAANTANFTALVKEVDYWELP